MRKALFIFYFFIIVFSLHAEEEKKTICLNMIIKDESKVIKRCLTSVKPLIDYWVIVDTGSTDGTQEIVKEFMKDIPGELHETAWKNFEFNRNDALDRARGKAHYLLIIDADETLSTLPDFELPPLQHDFYHIITKFGGTEYGRVQLIKNDLNWRWIGVLHEYLHSPQARTNDTLKGIYNVVFTDGARSNNPKKYEDDAELLEQALKENPKNDRYQFYLAQSYRDAGNMEKSRENYLKRIEMGGWDQEVFWSKLRVAQMEQGLKYPEKDILKRYYDAFNYRSSRVEPLYYLANYHREKGDYAQGYLIAKVGCSIPPSSDVLFVEKWIENWGLPLELSICAYWTGQYKKCEETCLKILSQPNLPPSVKECVERNLALNKVKLSEQKAARLRAMVNQ